MRLQLDNRQFNEKSTSDIYVLNTHKAFDSVPKYRILQKKV